MSNDDEVDHSGGKDDEQEGSRGDGSAAADRSSATNQQQLSSGSGDNRIALLSRQMQQQQQQQQHQYTPLQYSTRPDFSSAVRDASASFLNPSPYHHHHQHFSPFGSGGGYGIAGASSLATVGSDERNAAASMGLLRGGNSGGGGMTPTAAGESEQMMTMQQHQQQFHQYNMSQQPSGMKKSSGIGRESGEDPSSVLQYGSSMPHQYQIKSVLKEFPFVYDGHSGWVCRHCSHLPHTYRGLNYVWQGGEEGGTTQQPPPNSFVDQHLRFCPALNQPWAFSRETMTAAQGGGGQIPMQQPRGGIEGTEGEGGTVAAPEGEKEEKRPSRKRKPDPPTGRSPMANMTPAEAAAMFPVYSPHPYQMSMSTYGSPQMMKQPQRRKSSKSASPKGRQTTDANYEKALVLLKKRADEMPRPSSSDDDIGATLVQEEDNDLLTDYFYYMMYQLVVCRFTEKDRKTRGGKRQDVVVGYGGLQCAHCASTASSRKFFWSNVDRLANSFAEIPAHVLKCKMCPEDVLEALLALKGRHAAQMTLLPRGSQKVFLRRIWRRLHDKDTAAAAEAADTPAKRGIEVVGSALKSPEVASGTAAEILKKATAAASSPEAEHHQQQRVLIALPQDKDWLSDMDCFIRKQVEVFSANSVDVKDAKEDGKFAIQYGQVGLRCVHCAKVTKRARGDAVTYPHAISCIYESVRELQRLHFSDDNYCPNLPQELKSAQNRITTFASSLSSVLRRYYVQAAKALGLFDTEGGGIRAGGTVIPLLAAGFSGSVVAGKRRSSLVKEEDDNEEEEDGGEQQRPAKRAKQSDDDDDDIPKSPRPPAA